LSPKGGMLLSYRSCPLYVVEVAPIFDINIALYKYMFFKEIY
jgi:hypothetical protein